MNPIQTSSVHTRRDAGPIISRSRRSELAGSGDSCPYFAALVREC